MSNIEVVGIVVIGSGFILGLFIQVINLVSKLSEPVSKLTDAIDSLKLVVERLIVGQERIDNELQFHDGRLTILENRVHDVQLNCAKNTSHRKGTE